MSRKNPHTMPERDISGEGFADRDNADVPLSDESAAALAEPGGYAATDPHQQTHSRELVYAGESPAEQYALARSQFEQGRPYAMHCPTNIPRDTIQGRALIFAAMQPGDLELGTRKDLRIRARYWFVMPDRFESREGGEVIDGARTCLITAAGEVYRTSSEYGPQRAAQAAELFTAEEWERGIPLVITSRPSKRHPGGSWHDIRVDMAALSDGQG